MAKDKIIVLETNIDDCSPEILGYTLEKLFESGVKDAWCIPIFMKKTRPAYTLKVMVKPEQEEDAVHIIFKHTSAVGMRRYEQDRIIMDREQTTVETAYGHVKANRFTFEDIEKTSIEYESARALANEKNVSINEIFKTMKQ